MKSKIESFSQTYINDQADQRKSRHYVSSREEERESRAIPNKFNVENKIMRKTVKAVMGVCDEV